MMGLVEIILAIIALILSMIGVLGIQSGNPGLASSAAWSSFTLKNVPYTSGGFYQTLTGFCAYVTTSGGGGGGPPSGVVFDQCMTWAQAFAPGGSGSPSMSANMCGHIDQYEQGAPDDVLTALHLMCNNHNLSNANAAFMIIGFICVFVKVIMAGVTLCRAPKRPEVIGNIIVSIFGCFSLFLVIIMYGSQCYTGGDVDGFLNLIFMSQGGLPSGMTIQTAESDLEEGFGPGFFCTLFAAFVMLALTVIPCKALGAAGKDGDGVSLNVNGNP